MTEDRDAGVSVLCSPDVLLFARKACCIVAERITQAPYAAAWTGMFWVGATPFDCESAIGSCAVVVGSVTVVGPSVRMGVSAGMDSSTVVGLAACFLPASFSPLAARLGLRNRPPSTPVFCLVSPSVAPFSPVTSVVLSFFPPRVPNKDVRRFSLTPSGVVGLPVPVAP